MSLPRLGGGGTETWQFQLVTPSADSLLEDVHDAVEGEAVGVRVDVARLVLPERVGDGKLPGDGGRRPAREDIGLLAAPLGAEPPASAAGVVDPDAGRGDDGLVGLVPG
jgi:hypothetical protein